jgi:hypothetical protein
MFLLTRIKSRPDPQKTKLLGAICGTNYFQSKDLDLAFQVPAGILFGPVGPQKGYHPDCCKIML